MEEGTKGEWRKERTENGEREGDEKEIWEKRKKGEKGDDEVDEKK